MKHKRLFTVGAVFAALAVTVLFILTHSSTYLLISNEKNGEILFRAKVHDGEEFSVSYIHSVNKSPVTEYYQIQSTEIHLTAMRFSAFGAGMPEQPEAGQTMRAEDGYIYMEGFSRATPHLRFFIGRTAEHTLEYSGGTVPFETLGEPGQPVLFTVERQHSFFNRK